MRHCNKKFAEKWHKVTLTYSYGLRALIARHESPYRFKITDHIIEYNAFEANSGKKIVYFESEEDAVFFTIKMS